MTVVALSTHEWFAAAGGGILIGIAASALLVFNGRIAGVSGIVTGIFSGDGAKHCGVCSSWPGSWPGDFF
jgi:hypothetical protein